MQGSEHHPRLMIHDTETWDFSLSQPFVTPIMNHNKKRENWTYDLLLNQYNPCVSLASHPRLTRKSILLVIQYTNAKFDHSS